VLERLNEPSVAGWLGESYAHAASKQDRQPVLPTTGEVAGTRIATSLHSSSPFDPITTHSTAHHHTPPNTSSPSFSALSPRRYAPAETVSEQ
jgi:hypothetical protein